MAERQTQVKNDAHHVYDVPTNRRSVPERDAQPRTTTSGSEYRHLPQAVGFYLKIICMSVFYLHATYACSHLIVTSPYLFSELALQATNGYVNNIIYIFAQPLSRRENQKM